MIAGNQLDLNLAEEQIDDENKAFKLYTSVPYTSHGKQNL